MKNLITISNLKNLGLVLLIAAIVVMRVLISFKNDTIEKLSDNNNLLEAKIDTLDKSWNKQKNRYEYSKLLYIANEKNLKDQLKNLDTELATLKKKKPNTGTGIIETTTTIIDTVVINDTVSIKDTRVANISNQHYKALITSRIDSTELSIRMYDKMEADIDYKTGRITIIHSNPYIEVTELKGFQISTPKQKSKNWKYIVGGIVGGSLIYLGTK